MGKEEQETKGTRDEETRDEGAASSPNEAPLDPGMTDVTRIAGRAQVERNLAILQAAASDEKIEVVGLAEFGQLVKADELKLAAHVAMLVEIRLQIAECSVAAAPPVSKVQQSLSSCHLALPASHSCERGMRPPARRSRWVSFRKMMAA